MDVLKSLAYQTSRWFHIAPEWKWLLPLLDVRICCILSRPFLQPSMVNLSFGFRVKCMEMSGNGNASSNGKTCWMKWCIDTTLYYMSRVRVNIDYYLMQSHHGTKCNFGPASIMRFGALWCINRCNACGSSWISLSCTSVSQSQAGQESQYPLICCSLFTSLTSANFPAISEDVQCEWILKQLTMKPIQ